MGKKSTPKPPPAPDYAALAKQQAELSKTAAAEQTQANRVDQYNPIGSLTWSQDPNTGNWTQIEQLNPASQALLDAQQLSQLGLSNTGLDMLGFVQDAVQDPFSLANMPGVQGYDLSSLPAWGQAPGQYDFNALPQMGGQYDFGALGDMPEAGFGAVQEVQDAMMGRLNPALTQGRDREVQRLKAQGITEGTPAWQAAMQSLNQKDVDANQQALLGAMGAYGDIFSRGMAARQQGLQEQGLGINRQDTLRQQALEEQGMGLGRQDLAASYANMLRQAQLGEQGLMRDASLQDRQRAIQEMLMERQMPLNEFNAFMSGNQVQNPNFEGYTQATGFQPENVYGAAQDSYQAAMNNYNAQMAAKQNRTGGLLGLAGNIGGSFFGPIGSAVGGAIGKGIGGMFG